jgi:hypothetical protein
MSNVSGNRAYENQTFLKPNLCSVVQEILTMFDCDLNNLHIDGVIDYEDGITERMELEIGEIETAIRNRKCFRQIIFFSDKLRINFSTMFKHLFYITVGTDNYETIKAVFPIIEDRLSLTCSEDTEGKKVKPIEKTQNWEIGNIKNVNNIDWTIIWGRVLHLLKDQITEVNYKTWIEPLKLISIDYENKKMVVKAVNAFAKDWLESKYEPLFIAALGVIFNDHYQVYFVSGEENSVVQKDQPTYLLEKDVFPLIHYFLSASIHLTGPNALVSVDRDILTKVFTSYPEAIGIGFEDNIYQAAQKALDYLLLKSHNLHQGKLFVFIASGQSLELTDINNAIAYLMDGLQIADTPVFGAYVDESLKDKVVAGILGYE